MLISTVAGHRRLVRRLTALEQWCKASSVSFILAAAENSLSASVEHELLAAVRALKRHDGVIMLVHFTKIRGPSQTDA